MIYQKDLRRRTRILGIFRELVNSPHREQDDMLILKAVAGELSRQGHECVVVPPEELEEALSKEWHAVLPMCEAHPRLVRLKEWSQKNGTLFVNPPESVMGCYRTSMVPILSLCPELCFPQTEIRPTSHGNNSRIPEFMDGQGIWIKRGDVHNTRDEDVLRITEWTRFEAVRFDFESRNIEHMMLQKHIPGDLIKFYGVGPGQWFSWFYHHPQELSRFPFDAETLRKKTTRAAELLRLQVYGGDAIVAPTGTVHLLDINSWPSFARVRTEAASQIARHITTAVRPCN